VLCNRPLLLLSLGAVPVLMMSLPRDNQTTEKSQKHVTDLCSVHDAHVHASQAGVVQEGAVEGAAHSLVATEGEGNVGHTTADLAAGAHALDLARGAEEVDRIVVVLGHACADCEDVGVENDVLGLKADLLDQDAVCPLAHAHLQENIETQRYTANNT
jgi:hypothetical protein